MMKGIITGLLVLWLAQMASAGLFYNGNITIESIAADITIDNTANITAEYVIVNNGNKQESASLGYSETAELWQGNSKLSNLIVFAAGEEKTIELLYSGSIQGETTKTFSFDPTLTFNGKANSKKTGDFFVRVALPKGVNALLWSNQEYASSSIEDGRASYIWVGGDAYPTTLMVKWSTLGADLIVKKNVSPQRITEHGQVMTIELTLQNNGGKLEGLMLTDDYPPSEFEGLEPAQEFVLTGNESSNEPRLFWLKRLDQLQPNEKKKLTYSVKYIGDVSQIKKVSFKPLTVMLDGHLIGVSNEVAVSQMVKVIATGEMPAADGTGVPDVQEKSDKPAGSELALLLTVILLLIIVSFAILLIRKRRSNSSPK